MSDRCFDQEVSLVFRVGKHSSIETYDGSKYASGLLKTGLIPRKDFLHN